MPRVGRFRTAPLLACAGMTFALLHGCSVIAPGSTSPPATSTRGSTPPHPTPPVSAASPDFDGDGLADLAVGTGERPGRVLVRYATGQTDEITAATVASGSADSADFGQGLLAHDLNSDGFTDLVVADPNVETGPTLSWIRGGPTGLDAAAATTVRVAGVSGAGRALALLTEPRRVLLVGGGGTAASGAVLAYELGADGSPATKPRVLTPSSLGLPELPLGARFGTTLAATGSLLVIGAPTADAGSVRRAGAIYAVDASSDEWRAVTITQDSPGVPDTAQPGDRFGAALSAGDGFVAVGVPGEDRADAQGRSRRGTGSVQPFAIAGHDLTPLPAIDERTVDAPVAAGDAFGSAVAVLRPCLETVGVLIGAPAVTVGSEPQAGTAWLVPLSEQPRCGAREFGDGAGLGGAAAPTTIVGSAVGSLRNDSDGDALVIVSQGTWEEGVAGRVFVIDHSGAAVPVFDAIRVHEERVVALSPGTG